MKTHVIAPSCKQLFYFLLIFAVTAFTSCKKESTSEDPAITSEEAAEIMTESVTQQNDGIVTEIQSDATVSASDSSYCTINKTYVRVGTIISRLHRKLHFTRETTFKLINVVVNKTTRAIVSGSIELVIKGTNSAGRTFYYTGTLTFNGNSTGTWCFKMVRRSQYNGKI